MAKSVNKAILIGNAGGAPEFKDHGNGFVTATFSLATTDVWKDRASGERREHTDWHRIEVRGRLAEIVADIIKKGNLVYVEGSTRHDRVERKGEPGKYDTYTKVIAETVNKLSERERDEAGGDEGYSDEGYGDEGAGGGDAPAASTSAPAASRSPAPAPAPAAGAATGSSKWRNRGGRQ